MALDQLLHPTLDPQAPRDVLTSGLPASPGAASGEIVFDADSAERFSALGKAVVLVRNETSPEDIHGMHAAKGILTARGGMTSHAAVVARGMGRPCVSGAGSLQIDAAAKTLRIAGRTLKEGDIITLDDALDMVKSIGMITDTSPIASRMIAEIQAGFSQFTTQNTEPKKVLYLIWNNPLMAVGQNTFINSVLNCAGFLNVISFQYSRYPEITETEIQALQPDFIFLSSEPFPFNKTHESYFQYLCPKAKILKTDGELMSWYGSRLLKTPPYLKSLMDYTHAK